MKKIVITLAVLLSAISVDAKKAIWPNYINNNDCFKGNSCGQPELGKINPDMLENVDNVWSNPQFQGLTGYGHAIWFRWKIGDYIPANSGSLYENGLPLKTSWGEETPYVLRGFETTKFVVQVDSCTLTNSNRECRYSRQDNIDFDWRQVRNGIWLSAEASKTQGFLAIRYKMHSSNGFYLSVDKTKIKNASNEKLQFLARNLQFPPISVYYKVIKDNASDPTISTFRHLVFGNTVRLNDRKCELAFDPSSINFGLLSLTSSQNGKVGAEHLTTLKLNCTGAFLDDFNSNPSGGGNPYINGDGVIHSVVSARLSAGNEVTIDGKRKIGLTKNSTQASNLYIEGDTTSGQECGSRTTLELGNLTANPNSFGGSNNKFTGSREIYWRLCKKPGEVDGGLYTGSATISIDYK